MLPLNRFRLVLVSLVALSVWLGAQTSSFPAQAPSQQPQSSGQQQPGMPEPMPGDAPNQPGNTVQVPANAPQQGQAPSREEGGVYVFKKQVEEATSDGPYGAKGVGELASIPTAPAIVNAIYHATGLRCYGLPADKTWLKAALIAPEGH